MDDDQVFETIERLVEEEHRLLRQGEEEGGLDPDGHARLERVKVDLDRYWDLMRRRRAREEVGLPPEAETPRDPDTVENYLQ